MTDEARRRAWQTIQDTLPPGWRIGPPSYDPGTRRWSVMAWAPKTAVRLRRPEYVEASGETETIALLNLAIRLSGH